MNHKLKVAHIIDSSRIWGVENYVLNLGRALNKQQVETWVLCADRLVQETYERNGVRVKRFKLTGYLDFAGISSLIQFCKEQRIDIIHTHLGLDSLIGATVAKYCDISCVMSVHFLEPSWQSAGWLEKACWLPIQKWKNAQIDHFLPITEQVAERLVAREGIDKSRTTVVHPGIPEVTVSPETRTSIRTSMGVQSEECVVLSLSRLEPEKNISGLIDSAAVLATENKHIQFWVAGDGSLKQALDQQISLLGLDQRFRLLGYRLDIRELLSAADIFVLPCPVEAFGIAALEAMFASLPVVGFGNAGLSVIVSDSQTGLLANNEEIDSLTNCIRLLSNDAERRQNFGREGQKRALLHFSDEIMATKILKVYQNVITGSVAR